MNRDDIIRMAREAGWDDHHAQFDTRLQTFAALVASAAQAKEREACAKVCENKETLLAWPTYAAAIRARGQA